MPYSGYMSRINQLLDTWNGLVWGIPMMALLFGTHLLFTVWLKVPQRKLLTALRLSVAPEEGEEGMRPFEALATALAATLGTGNIIGMSMAVAIGGPGAVFWCWLTGIFGMATKYGESLLSIKYRIRDGQGGFRGGPMYVMEQALRFRKLAAVFAVFAAAAAFGTGCSVQANAISGTMESAFHIPPLVTGGILTALTAAVILGGAGAVSKACEKLIPFMAVVYLAGCGVLLVINRAFLVPALKLIVTAAFSPGAAAGGFVGSTMLTAARQGIARGLFSDESGLGTAPMAAAAAGSRNPVRQALAAMTGTVWDTVVFCAVTGIVIVSSMLHMPELFAGLSQGELAEQSFGIMNQFGHMIFALSLVIFAFATILGWSFYGEQAVIYLSGSRRLFHYRMLYLAAVFAGAAASMGVIWKIADLLNGLMAVPNLICLLLLRKTVVKETDYYLWGGHLDEKEENPGEFPNEKGKELTK